MSIGGRSTTVALILAVIAVGWIVFQPRSERPGPSLPKVTAVSRPAPATFPPTAREILDGGLLLDLRDAQRTRLSALEAEWIRESTASRARLDAAVADFSRFMDEARAGGRTSIQEIQRHSAEIGALSAELRERRRLHAEAAAAILTPWQRGRLDKVTGAMASGGQR